MHVLDFFMYFPCLVIFWYLLKWGSNGEFTEEIGALVGWFLCFLFTIIYIIVFVIYPDWNWIDIFTTTPHITFKL